MATAASSVTEWSPLVDASRTERLLWGLVGLSMIGDVVTTLLGLHMGLSEANPAARTAIEGAGVFGMLALKAGAIVFALACRRLVDPPFRPIVPAALAIPWTTAVAVNLYMITMVA